jgi:CheY-like chemotaxis protein
MIPDPAAPCALVVDDDLFILMTACDMLETAGFRPLEAHDVAEAIEQLEAHDSEIALLFTDVQMPGGRNGFDLARETAARWPDTRILIASGAQAPQPGELPEGAIFLHKPFNANLVYDRLQQLLPEGKRPAPLERYAGA